MSNYLSQKINKITRMDTVYSSLMEDEILEKTPKKYTAVSRNRNFLRSSRNLFRNSSKTLKICRKNSNTTENARNKIRVLMDELQNKIQFWSQELKNNFQQNQKESKTPNCVTPNRRIRRMLGRTPEQLYSPFAIETPPSGHRWRKLDDSKTEDPFASVQGWLTPPKRSNFNRRKPPRSPLFH